MHKISIRPQWTISHDDGEALGPRLIDLLVCVAETGSIAAACQRAGLSYRHAWDTIRHGEVWFGAPLLQMERGRGSRLTPLGDKLVWADRRIAARLAPALDTLASELEVELQRVIAPPHRLLRIHASHGFAIEKLMAMLGDAGVDVERVYTSSQDAAASLHDGASDLACFHVPHGALEARGWEFYAHWLDPREHVVIDITDRTQGLMVAPGNPLRVQGLADLVRPGLRFINRQRGSGTRFLLDALLGAADVDTGGIVGYEHGEFTHAAVAAFIGSGMADVGFGLERPARHFKLDFIPLATERYFAICRRDALARPEIEQVLAILRSDAFRAEVDALPGYAAGSCGTVHLLGDVLAAAGLRPIPIPPAASGPRPAAP
ncbi:MAG: substrate-binding domain-containing protein [Vitreoscilla sp.]